MKRLNVKGFTLHEILIVTAITGILIIVVMTFLTNTLVNQSVASARADLLREVQLSMDVITRDIRLSAAVDENNRWNDANAPDAPTDLLSWEADEDTLILALAAKDDNRNVLFDDALHYITHKNNIIYFVEDNILYGRTLAGDDSNNAAVTSCPSSKATSSCPADRVLIRGVTDFTVTYFNNDNAPVEAVDARSVNVSLTVEAKKYDRTITAQFATRTVFRNE
jgi:prepilin-type N-terminal cleavage/methylation domain-containing protein